MTLTTSAAGHGLHSAFSKQPGINYRKSEFTEEIERTDYSVYPNYYMSNKKCEAIK